MKYRIVEDFVGEGKTYRKVYFVYRGDRTVCRFSSLESARRTYPDATIELL